jgi:glycosyltransferase involved in cell wall biosynthesis
MENRMSLSRRPKIALISVGLGRVQRGFERWCGDLFGVLDGELECILYRGAGASARGERVPPFLPSYNAIFRRLPLARGEKAEYKRECAAFAFSLIPDLMLRKFDVIHCVDPPMIQVLHRIRKLIPLPGRILFTEGSAQAAAEFPHADHLHFVAKGTYEQALARGLSPANATLVPAGVHTQKFAPIASRAELRRKHGVPENAFVMLAVSALRRAHKRIDYLIDDVSKVDGEILLWLDGHLEDADLPAYAARKLGDRCRITHVRSDEVASLYGLADVMVQASLNEAFGLSVVEALSSGVMALAHRSPHFEWLTGDPDCLIDMSAEGCLAERLRLLAANRDTLCRRSARRAARARECFDWARLAPDYIRMYRTVVAAAPARRVA